MASSRPRKKIKPTPMSDLPSDPLPSVPSASHVSSATPAKIVNQSSGSSDSKVVSVCEDCVKCVNEQLSPPVELWTHSIADPPLFHFAVVSGFVAISTSRSLSVLSLDKGDLLKSLFTYATEPLYLKFLSNHHLCFVLGDGVVFLWRLVWGDLLSCELLLRTSISSLCKPNQIRAFNLSPSGVLEITVANGGRFFFKEDVQAWTYLEPSMPRVESEEADKAYELYFGAHLEKSFKAESDCLVSFCYCDAKEAQERLANFAWLCAEADDRTRLVGFCSRLLGNERHKDWLSGAIADLNLDCTQLVRDIILPELLNSRSGGPLWDEISSLIQPGGGVVKRDVF